MPAGHVVVADDSSVNRLLLTGILEDAGWRVRAACDGREALALIEREPPELVLLDVQMPELDGYGVCRELQSRPGLSSIPVVFISALDDISEKVRGFEAGGVDYVTKPFEPAEVLARLGTQVKLFRAQKELKKRNAELQRKNELLLQAQERTQRMFVALSEALPGTVLDDTYQLDEKIGEGGFGAVYRGMHLRLRKPVAVKVLRPSHGGEDNLARFKREGIAACRVTHPNAIDVIDFGISSTGMPYLVMELLRGRTLGSLLRETGKLPLSRCADIMAPVCEALEAAHAAGIVHRDIKPDNVFLHQGETGEVVKVLDFGIAKLLDDPTALESEATQVGSLIGTPMYMAPERLLGSHYDARSDIYSVGVVLYVALSGEMPFEVEAPRLAEMVKLHLTRKARPIEADVPEDVADAVMRALDREPEGRPPLREIVDVLRG